MADALVELGVPFREGHHIVGALVAGSALPIVAGDDDGKKQEGKKSDDKKREGT